MMNVLVKCTCPSCFEEIYLGDCRILSTRTSGNEMKGRTRDAYHRFTVEPLTGTKYTRELARRECYVCQYLLPYNIEQVRSITIVVVGDVSSGKSHYLAAFIRQLQTEWISNLGSNIISNNNASGYATLECLTKDVEEKYMQEYFEPLFKYKTAPAQSQRAQTAYASPLIYELAVAPGPHQPVKTINLLLYDTSGEDYVLEERLVNFARFVLNTDAFIYVVNPVVIEKVFQSLPAALQMDQKLRDQFDDGQLVRPGTRFNSILSLYGRHHGQRKGANYAGTPFAMMISKSDLLPGTLNCKNPAYYGGEGINLRDVDNINNEVRNLLYQYGEGSLVVSTRRLEKAKFFATSATGCAPDAQGVYSTVNPLRCLDPVLWILHELNVVKGVK